MILCTFEGLRIIGTNWNFKSLKKHLKDFRVLFFKTKIQFINSSFQSSACFTSNKIDQKAKLKEIYFTLKVHSKTSLNPTKSLTDCLFYDYFMCCMFFDTFTVELQNQIHNRRFKRSNMEPISTLMNSKASANVGPMEWMFWFSVQIPSALLLCMLL